ncbi:MAG TPA: CDGSH iron-sulfur domain-containing protein [Actinophytocola sp.]|uniref:CDGSH iron-sulfur domain-containing protein n=1 Tax=Actinophytocola sp. TaxID=1872138 RepID=UPI002DDCB923|nr:CDGSH iron-sulfur domain-containing protein [Actinophytocola sp.]HEV2778711.1 CDGSH iron-sulfur domain-containing protein [Actinophytocola sp.]
MATDPTRTADRRRVTVVPGGPLLVEGPVELVTEDGTTVCSDRFLVAVCTCRRSKRFPLCDTSHRQRVRTGSA